MLAGGLCCTTNDMEPPASLSTFKVHLTSVTFAFDQGWTLAARVLSVCTPSSFTVPNNRSQNKICPKVAEIIDEDDMAIT